MVLIRWWRSPLKDGGAYFKVRKIVHIKFQNFDIVTLQCAKAKLSVSCIVSGAVIKKTSERTSQKNKWNNWNILMKEFIFQWNSILKACNLTKNKLRYRFYEGFYENFKLSSFISLKFRSNYLRSNSLAGSVVTSFSIALMTFKE